MDYMQACHVGLTALVFGHKQYFEKSSKLLQMDKEQTVQARLHRHRASGFVRRLAACMAEITACMAEVTACIAGDTAYMRCLADTHHCMHEGRYCLWAREILPVHGRNYCLYMAGTIAGVTACVQGFAACMRGVVGFGNESLGFSTICRVIFAYRDLCMP